jgi:hypothetical protein
MGAGQSTPLCDFSEEQISILQKESEQIFELITILKNKDEYDTQIGVINRRLLRSESPPDIPFYNVMFNLRTDNFNHKHELLKKILGEHLIVKHVLCLEIENIFRMFGDIFKKIIKICDNNENECQNVDKEIETIMTGIEDVKSCVMLFDKDYKLGNSNGDEYGTQLKFKFDKLISPIIKTFTPPERIKSEIETLCAKKKQEAQTEKMFSRAGGSSSSRSKKRKQMKMKSSNSHSKTRNSKKKYNRKSVKK